MIECVIDIRKQKSWFKMSMLAQSVSYTFSHQSKWPFLSASPHVFIRKSRSFIEKTCTKYPLYLKIDLSYFSEGSFIFITDFFFLFSIYKSISLPEKYTHSRYLFFSSNVFLLSSLFLFSSFFRLLFYYKDLSHLPIWIKSGFSNRGKTAEFSKE